MEWFTVPRKSDAVNERLFKWTVHGRIISYPWNLYVGPQMRLSYVTEGLISLSQNDPMQ